MELVRRPRVARETRLLFTVALLAAVALWALARLRFPESAPAGQTVPPILAPFVVRQGYSVLESQLADVWTRTSPSLEAIAFSGVDRRASPAPLRHVAALRLYDDVAVALPDAGEDQALYGAPDVVARDTVTGLAVLRLASGPAAPIAEAWPRRDPMVSRYVMQTMPSAAGTSLAPVIVGALTPAEAPLWSGTLWVPTTDPLLVPGAFLFTPEGEWIGLVVRHHGGPAIAPAELVSHLANAALSRAAQGAVTLGIEVQALTPALGEALGQATGVAVTWVAPDGPARATLRVADVLHGADRRPLPTIEHWRRHLADLGPNPTVLTVWRGGQSIEVPVSAVAVAASPPSPASPSSAPPPPRRPFGVTARRVAGVGAAITGIQPGSAGAAADLRVGDVITQFGAVSAPTPAQLRTLAAGARDGQSLLTAVTRGGAHHLTVVVP